MSYSPQLLASNIMDLVRADYSGYDVSFTSSYVQEAPSTAHSTVYITASSGEYLGLADDVDWYNENLDDNAVVFAGLMTGSGISKSEFVQIVANVTSHETGHLLGLAHTDDDTELMDQVTPQSSLEEDQSFGRAPLPEDEFPIGYQDSLELLAFSIGM
jgi:predicted Zn-dependent protease